MKTTLRFISSILFLFILLALLFSYAMFQGGFVSWFLFYSFLPLFIYQLGFIFYPIRKWDVTRTLSDHIGYSGDNIRVTININRKIPFPIYYCVFEEVVPDSLNKIDDRNNKFQFMHEPEKLNVKRHIKKVIFPWFKREFSLEYELNHIPRGEHTLNNIRIRSMDVFGFITKVFTFKQADELIVYPNKRDIHFSDRLSSFSKGSSSAHMVNLKQTGTVSGIREYTPGDKYSWIHWKQTARRNEIITKEFEQERSTETLLVIDRCDYLGINDLAVEGMIEVVVALMAHLKKQTSSIEVLSIGADTIRFPYHQNPKIEEKILQHLTRLHPSLDKPFSLKLKEEILQFNAEITLMIVTTKLDIHLVQICKQIKQRHKNTMIFFIQAEMDKTIEQEKHMEQLNFLGVKVYVITQKELARNPIEVIM